MTVSTQNNVAIHRGNGAATEFDYTFRVLDETHLTVQRRDYVTKIVDKTYLPSEYTVAGIGTNAGSVTLNGPALSDDYEVVITRTVPVVQEVDIVNQGGFFPEVIEEQLDLTTMGLQQVREKAERSLTLPPGETGSALPSAAERAGKYIAFNASGDPYVTEGTGSNSSILPDLASTDPGKGAALVGTESGRTLAEKTDEIKSIADFTDVAEAFSASRTILLPDGTKEFADSPTVARGFGLFSVAGGELYQEAEATPAIFFDALNPKRDTTELIGARLSQVKGADISGGTNNNHALAKYTGGYRHRNALNAYDGQYGISFGYGLASETDRRTMFNIALGNTFRDMEGMGIENLGNSCSTIVGNVGSGANAANVDGRATFHAIRVSGYSLAAGDTTDAQVIGIVGAGNAFSGFSNGIALQNSSRLFNFSANYFENAKRAILISDSTALSSRATLGIVNFTSRQTDRVIENNAGNRIEFNFAADASDNSAETPAIEEFSAGGAKGFNQYRGILVNPPSTGALLRYNRNAIDIRVDGGGASGLTVAGSYCRIDAIVDGVASAGANITGSNNTGRIIATNCGTNGLSVAGNNNVIQVMTDGNVTITGNNNVISGKATGTITVTGTGNILTGLNPLKGTATYDPMSILAGDVLTTTISVPGAARQLHKVEIHNSQPLDGVILTAWVDAAGDQVTVQFYNPTSSNVDLPNGLLTAILTRV